MTMSTDLTAIDYPQWCWRAVDAGKRKAWYRGFGAATGDLPLPPLQREATLAADGAERCRLTQPVTGVFRYFGHRIPRPDACTMVVRLLPRDDQTCALRMQPQQENAYKHVTDALWTGMQAPLTEMGLYPCAGLDICLDQFIDDGPSANGGLEEAGAWLIECMLLEAYRGGAMPFL